MVTLQTLQRTAAMVDSVIIVGDGCFLLVYSLLPAARAPALGSTCAGAWGCSALPAVAPALGASGHSVGQLEEAAKTPFRNVHSTRTYACVGRVLPSLALGLGCALLGLSVQESVMVESIWLLCNRFQN